MKFFKYLAIALCLSFTGLLQAQDGDIILSVENEKVTKQDFESIFRKNNRDSLITKESLDEYMELFVNFKLKVREAMELGLDTASGFKRELSGYRKQLARPYLVDQELLDELIKEAYERQKEEIRASHILIKVDPNASPEDTMKAYERLIDLRNRIIQGENFADVATSKNGSQDPSVRDNKGDLGYFTSFQMVYPFEQAAFTTPVGEVSSPVRTRYGYHILQINDRRQARGEILTAHIMIRFDEKKDPNSKSAAESKANEIYELLQAGGDFGELATKYSEDASTAKRGGELPWFGTGKMVEAFEDISFDLKNDGDFSQPFITPYGYHIVKRLEYRPVPSFDEVKNDIKSKVSRDARAEMTKNSFISKLENEYDLAVDDKCMKPLYKAAAVDSAFKGKGLAPLKSKILSKTLLSFADQERTVSDFVNHLNAVKIKNKQLSSTEIVDQELDNFIEDELMSYEDSQLETKHRDFRLLMNEYHDGILLFELTDQKVWSKAVKDSTGLAAYYESNKNQFMWQDRAKSTIYTVKNEKLAKKVRSMIKQGKTPDEIKSQLNKDTQLNLSFDKGTFEKDAQEVFSKIDWKEGVSDNIIENDQIIIVHISEIIPSQAKTLDEAKGLITAEYQNFLEKEWIAALRAKYSYEINKAVLHSIE
ncbi:MAG: peptidylprolyl isomerase [Flavobacteriales bacterium]